MKHTRKTSNPVGSDFDLYLEEGLKDAEMAAAFINAAIEENDSTYLPIALGKVAKAHGMAEVSSESGIGREALYKMLSGEGNPGLANIIQILHACGLTLAVQPSGESPLPESHYIRREDLNEIIAKTVKETARVYETRKATKKRKVRDETAELKGLVAATHRMTAGAKARAGSTIKRATKKTR